MSAEIWDNVWNQRFVISDYSLQYRKFTSQLSKKIKIKSKVLEAGCGTGEGLIAFSKDHDTYGLDISEKALELAKENCKHPVKGDIFKIPFPENTFDLVFNSGVLEHFKEPNNLKAAKEMVRVTKKGGLVVIILPNAYCIWYRIYKKIAQLLKQYEFGYEEEYSTKRLEKLTKDAGLEIIEKFGLQAFVATATNRFQLLPFYIRKHLVKLDLIFPFKEHYAFGTGVVCRKP